MVEGEVLPKKLQRKLFYFMQNFSENFETGKESGTKHNVKVKNTEATTTAVHQSLPCLARRISVLYRLK